MKNLLPRVNPAVGASLEHELSKKVDKIYIAEQLSIIKQENPVISFWIENFSKKTRDKKGAMFCALMVFRLLSIQAECDKMSDDIKL